MRQFTAYGFFTICARGVNKTMDVCKFALTYKGEVFSLAHDYGDACIQFDSWKKTISNGEDLSIDDIAIAAFGKDIKICHLDCSFCGKHHKEVKRVLAGPNVYICNECIELSVDIMREHDANFCMDKFTGFEKND